MASVTSLGVHKPVALPYLIAEGLLPPDPKPASYQWDTYTFDEGHGEVEEQTIATRDCVVWSQGGHIKKVYHFGLEGEDVRQALLTQFPRLGKQQPSPHADGLVNGVVSNGTEEGASTSIHIRDAQSNDAGSQRALVVVLKSKAHIYFLDGSQHIVPLPFEIERAFPAPRGLVLQRKPSPLCSRPPTPKGPQAPNNSFFSSQIHAASSHLQTPTSVRDFAGSKPTQPSLLGGGKSLDDLLNDIVSAANRDGETEPAALYSLGSSLSDLGVMTYSIQHQKPRFNKGQQTLSVEFEALDPSESVVYVSAQDELVDVPGSPHGPLMLIITSNNDLRTLTVWHAWYIEERSLASLLKQREIREAAKARRRSSFISVANVGTGATTPAVRHRDGPRESFTGAGPQRLPGEPEGTQRAKHHPRKPTRQEEEEAFASQMDPDFQPVSSQQSGREPSRRISSLLSRGEADPRVTQQSVGPSFGGPGGRRHTSFGPNDRRSFGHSRRSRGSTPGSMYSRSIGGIEDDTMDLDSTFDEEESIESVVSHVRATYEAAGTDYVLGVADGGFKKELLVRKVHSLVVTAPNGVRSPADAFEMPYQAAVLAESDPTSPAAACRVSVYLHSRRSKALHCLTLEIHQRSLWSSAREFHSVAVPVVVSERLSGQCESILKLKDGTNEAILLGQEGLVLNTIDGVRCPLPDPSDYRMFSALDTLSVAYSNDKDVGRNRILPRPGPAVAMQHAGAEGAYDEVALDGTHHRRKLSFWPSDECVRQYLEACRRLLPQTQTETVQRAWCIAYASLARRYPKGVPGTASSLEFVALVVTIFTYTIELLDDKARASLNVSRLASTPSGRSICSSLQHRRGLYEARLFNTRQWSWMGNTHLTPSISTSSPPSRKAAEASTTDRLLPIAAALADELLPSIRPRDRGGSASTTKSALPSECAMKLMLGLHILREEQRLDVMKPFTAVGGAVIAQLGSWLGLRAWGYTSNTYFALDGASEQQWAFVKSNNRLIAYIPPLPEPVGVLQWWEDSLQRRSIEPFSSLSIFSGLDISLINVGTTISRLSVLATLLQETDALCASAATILESMAKHSITLSWLETLPSSITAPFREAIAQCERSPPTTWSTSLLHLVGREDLVSDLQGSDVSARFDHGPTATSVNHDVQAVCHALEQPAHATKTKEASRHAVSQLIFCEDRRLVEAASLMHFNSVQVAECPKQPDWSDAYHLEQQRQITQWVMVRMISLPAGDGMLRFDSQTPLLTERYHLPGFNANCIMYPMGHTVTTDRSGLTEERVNWAYFHAGVSVGLRIARNASGIDTSWVVFNKPSELTNRHAGLLLALGLGGHLRSLAKWLSFKYLTPKHTMTSVGLLLGLSASYMGTMDSLITRMLSVHITRMLPPGAAELNVSPITQTAGLMGIGLLYYNSQHRRMSEVMLSEVEHVEVEDPDNGPDMLRDESYRLAAGFALGYINVGKGADLRGLHGMHLPERLLAVAIGPRSVGAVHVYDKSSAGAIVALAIVYMKTGNAAIARKIDVPDTEAQFDQVRPDMLMLRTMAKHIILWDEIHVADEMGQPGVPEWIQSNLPTCYHGRLSDMVGSARRTLKSSDIAFFNICTGLAWALSLKYAGSGNNVARDEILAVLSCFYRHQDRGEAFYYDGKLARAALRRCIDVLALSAATVMAGTGDLDVFRHLRRLHGRTHAETPYGSHFAAHLAIGMLFLGGGTYTFGTSNLAVASLICSTYPLFPTDVHDNRVHLQAFRHFWVFAAEARCIVIEDIDTQRPIHMPVTVELRTGKIQRLRAPCLLPQLDLIASIQTDNPAYWRVTLDFERNASHVAAFKKSQRVFVRSCPVSEAHASAFGATLAALNDAQSSATASAMWRWIFGLPSLSRLDRADMELVLPPDIHSSLYTTDGGTAVDDQLVLINSVSCNDRDALWNLRCLFAWAEKARDSGNGRLRWLGQEVVEGLKIRIGERARSVSATVE